MDENMRSRLAESVRSFHIPRLGEIPDVGLYLEQVTRYVNQSITGCGLSPITASMVSNYVKQKIIPGRYVWRRLNSGIRYLQYPFHATKPCDC